MGRVLAVLQTGRGPRPLLRSERHLPPPQPIVPADLGGASPHGTAVVGELRGEGDILTGLTLGRGLGELRPGPKAHQNLPPPLPFPSWQRRNGLVALSGYHSATGWVHSPSPTFSLNWKKKM